MKTNKLHPSARHSQQYRKKLMRSCKKKIPHHSRKWWKAWHKTWKATHQMEGEGEMNCPKCGYDLFPIYEEVLYENKKTKYCKIVDFRSDNTMEVMDGHSWTVKCKCPKCKTEWFLTDSDY